MNRHAAHSSLWKTSDVIFGGAVLFSLVLEYLFPLSMENFFAVNNLLILGGIMVLAGLFIIVLAKVQFSRAKQPSAPGKPTTNLVQSGIFNYTRNPLYLGLVIVMPGLGMMLNIAWLLILTVPVVIIVQRALILPEEEYLAGIFADEYTEYVAHVRRWI